MNVKRAFDLVASGFGLVATAPLMIAAAAAVKVESPGPIIFTQERVGRDGRTFRIHKFRSMRTDTTGPAVTAGRDPRITRSGAVLRKTKIDELPQLWDVFRGEMSLVGPRPEVPQYVELWPTDLREVILSVRPGITDPVTLDLRNEQDLLALQPDPEDFYRRVLLPEKAARYAEYCRSRTFWGDMSIMARTVASVVRD